jgi:hypothetical protein
MYHSKEDEMIAYLEDRWKCKIARTSTFCIVDGIIMRDNQIKGIIELKNRHHSYEQMKQFDTLLLSFDKITIGRELSKTLNVPFYVAMRTSDDIYLYWKICDNGIFTIAMMLDHKETNKRTEINNDGSKISRYNAFLKINQAKKI